VPVHVHPVIAWSTFGSACWGVPLTFTAGVTSQGPVNLTGTVTYWMPGSPLPHVHSEPIFAAQQHHDLGFDHHDDLLRLAPSQHAAPVHGQDRRR
jgi:hypothetical protein